MAEEDDDLGGGTMIMTPEERSGQVPSRVTSTPGFQPPAAPAPDIDDEPGMGTMVMGPGVAPPPPRTASAAAFALTMPADALHEMRQAVTQGVNMVGGSASVPQNQAQALSPQPTLETNLSPDLGAPTMNGIGPDFAPDPSVRAAMASFGSSPAAAPRPGGFVPPGGMPLDPPTTMGAESASKRRLLALSVVAGLLVVAFVAAVVLLVRMIRQTDAANNPTATATVAGTGSPATASLTVTTTAPQATTTTAPDATAAPSTNAPSGDAKEVAARAALEKLKIGVEKCVKTTIHVLPGTSRAIPASLSFLKHGEYKPLINDWSAPFFSCTGFRLEGPLGFMIQWQLDHPNDKGTGMAWIDDDGDGKADRAFAFTATLTKRDVVEFSPIEGADVSRGLRKGR